MSGIFQAMKDLTVAQVAELLGVTRVRVHQLIRAGRLPAEKFGRDYMIKETDAKKLSGRKTGRPRKRASR